MNSTTEQTTAKPAIIGELAKPTEVVVAERKAQAAIDGAKGMRIDSRIGYEAAADELQTLRDQWRAIEAQRVHLKEPYLEGGRRIDAFFKGPLDRLKEAADVIKAGMLTFDSAEQARLRKEREEAERLERERQQELQRQQAELDRQEREAREKRELAERQEQERLQKIADDAAAETARIQREADEAAAAANAAGDQAAAEEARRQAEQAQAEADRKAQAARDEADRQAAIDRQAAADAEAESQRQAQQLQESVDLAAVTPMAVVSSSAAKASGTSTTRTWKAVSIDLRALVLGVAKAIEDGSERADEMLSYLEANESGLNGLAKHLKGGARVPGVVFGEVSNIRASSRGKGRAGS